MCAPVCNVCVWLDTYTVQQAYTNAVVFSRKYYVCVDVDTLYLLALQGQTVRACWHGGHTDPSILLCHLVSPFKHSEFMVSLALSQTRCVCVCVRV